MNRVRLLRCAALCVVASTFAVVPQTVRASASSTLTVTATIANVCQLNTSTATVAFGAYDPVVANKTTALTTTLAPAYTCTSGDSTYTWTFASANVSSGSCRMTDGAGHFLTYSISDGTTSTYCAGAGHVAASEATATGSSQTYSSFTFTLAAGQNQPAGSYTDTNTLTIAP